jgi:ADP-heptose:LPS heptosyltransferase
MTTTSRSPRIRPRETQRETPREKQRETLRGVRIARIAVVRALQLGDLLVAVPALRALRARFPHAEVTLIGLPWAASFAQRFSHYVNRFIEFPGWPGIAEATYNAPRTREFLEEQQAYGYDLVIQLHGSGEASNPFALALGGRVTAGYAQGAAPDGLTYAAPYPDDQREVMRALGLVRLLGCAADDAQLEFPLSAADHAEAQALLAPLVGRGAPLIGIHAGARASARRWPAESFAAVADALAREHGAQIVLTGAPDEAEIVAAVAHTMRTPALDLAGKTSLGGLAALLTRLDLFIGNDTGTAHVAQAVGAPSVTIFGPADPQRWAPLDSERHMIVRRAVVCSPCGYRDCPIDHRCLRLISPALVLAAAQRCLTKGACA